MAAPPALGDTTIGQVPSTTPGTPCPAALNDFTQPTVTGGTNYIVPTGGGTITSWSTFASADAAQTMKFKVFRLVSGNTYKVVGHDGPRSLAPSSLNTFAGLHIPVQPGDVIGLATQGSVSGCLFNVNTEVGYSLSNGTDLADGASNPFASTMAPYRVNTTATVGPAEATGQRAAALAKCKHKHPKKKRKKCRRKANLLPV